MAFFYLHQRVRIVRSPYPDLIGRECTLTDSGEVSTYTGSAFGWCTDIRHPVRWRDYYGVFESDIEPLKYEPDAEDLATIEAAPNFNCPVPVAA